ncbi:hypothetical protein FRC19_002225 [Serendipita sp. 401]|nr:hypothetical protein FRC19_002225 [Serendipita sp. 401]
MDLERIIPIGASLSQFQLDSMEDSRINLWVVVALGAEATAEVQVPKACAPCALAQPDNQ